MKLLRHVLMMMFLVFVVMAAVATGQLAKPDCHKCGDITIPYPFGIGKGCYFQEAFSVECRQPNKPLVQNGSLPVLSISLEGYLRVSFNSSYSCYTDGNETDTLKLAYSFPHFVVSSTQNELTTLGCGSYAALRGSEAEQNLISCVTQCSIIGYESNGICSGHGCCRVDIPPRMTQFHLSVLDLTSEASLRRSYPCSYAFVVEQGQYDFNASDIWKLNRIREYPVVLDWSIGQENCNEAIKKTESYACKSQKSFCVEPENAAGYRCNCSHGYGGNPYLPNGCQDINECDDEILNDCIQQKTCRNIEGNYTCGCSKGHYGDGRMNGIGCIAKGPVGTKIIIGVTIGLLVLLLGLSWLYLLIRQKRLNKLGEHFFERNGGVLLRQKLTELERSKEETKLLSAKDLKKATNNYHESRILGQGGQGTVYKGILPNKIIVAIKKAKIGDGSQIGQFINEVIILSQINHRNVVKILGCCLETEVPSLVYEFVSNGSLFDHMHSDDVRFTVSWRSRLKIASEIAGALSYLHSAASIPIIHRDIKSANILLDDSFKAKISDFGASRLVPQDKDQLTTLVQGTLGYLDPEYFQTSHLNEKSDVYSFGVVLMELITGEKAFSFSRKETRRYLANHVASAIQQNCLVEVLDKRVLNEKNFEQLQGVACLAQRCVRFKGEERPTMIEVATELRSLRDGKEISIAQSDEGYELITINNRITLEINDEDIEDEEMTLRRPI